MKMLTLWACLEPTDGSATQLQAAAPLAWKQAWQKAGETAKSLAAEHPVAEKPAPRQPVT